MFMLNKYITFCLKKVPSLVEYVIELISDINIFKTTPKLSYLKKYNH